MNEELRNKLEELNQKIVSLKIDINELRKEFKTDVANLKTINTDILNVNQMNVSDS